MLALATLVLGMPAKGMAKSIKLTCTLDKTCTAQGKCKGANPARVIRFCVGNGPITVAAQGGKIGTLNRLKNEADYAALPNKVIKGRKLDVGNWIDLDRKDGRDHMITFVMREDDSQAILFDGDPLASPSLGYSQGTCAPKSVTHCKANQP